MTDEEIMDFLSIPAERREEWLLTMHAWARQYLPGPGIYLAWGVVVWQMMQLPRVDLPDDPFDPAAWLTT